MFFRRIRQRLSTANGWQRIWCLLATVSALALAVGLSVGVYETDGVGHETFVGSLLCHGGPTYWSCNVGWGVLWVVTITGLYLSGLAITWIAEGFKEKR